MVEKSLAVWKLSTCLKKGMQPPIFLSPIPSPPPSPTPPSPPPSSPPPLGRSGTARRLEAEVVSNSAKALRMPGSLLVLLAVLVF